jgi:DNA-binding transcriptional regulator YiaG
MNKPAPVPGWVAITTTYDVPIPSADGLSVVGHKTIEVPAWKAPDGEIYLDDEANDKIDQTKARLMGILSPTEIKNLRKRLGLTQKRISELLQIGEKSWTRWETGRERPTRAINLLLCALNEGKIDITYLSCGRCSKQESRRIWSLPLNSQNSKSPTLYEPSHSLNAPMKSHDNDPHAIAA